MRDWEPSESLLRGMEWTLVGLAIGVAWIWSHVPAQTEVKPRRFTVRRAIYTSEEAYQQAVKASVEDQR